MTKVHAPHWHLYILIPEMVTEIFLFTVIRSGHDVVEKRRFLWMNMCIQNLSFGTLSFTHAGNQGSFTICNSSVQKKLGR